MADDTKRKHAPDLTSSDDPGRATRRVAKRSARSSKKVAALQDKAGNKSLYSLIAAVLSVVLLLLILAAVFLMRQELSFSFLAGESRSTFKNYLKIGPMSATLSNHDIINFTLEIDCTTDDVKKRLSEKDSLVKNQILAIITAPDSGALFETHQYEQIKSRIREHLEEISGESVGDVYFSELRIY